MSDTPETDEAWAAVSRTPDGWHDSRVPVFAFAKAMADHSKKLERQRNAYAETLRLIAASPLAGIVTALIIDRHPELKKP